MAKKPQPEPNTCASCKHIEVINPGDEAGYCHRYPRIWVVREGDEGSFQFPPHDLTDWCGEWCRRLNS